MPPTKSPPPKPDSMPVEGKLQLSSLADDLFASAGPLPQGTESFGDTEHLELVKKAPPPRAQRPIKVVDWQQERQSLQTLVRTDRGVWFVAKVIEAFLALKLAMTATGAAEDSRLGADVDLVLGPLMWPVDRLLARAHAGELPGFARIGVAMLVYFIVFSLIARVVRAIPR